MAYEVLGRCLGSRTHDQGDPDPETPIPLSHGQFLKTDWKTNHVIISGNIAKASGMSGGWRFWALQQTDTSAVRPDIEGTLLGDLFYGNPTGSSASTLSCAWGYLCALSVWLGQATCVVRCKGVTNQPSSGPRALSPDLRSIFRGSRIFVNPQIRAPTKALR